MRNFNELVLGCHKNWDKARSILAEGMWPMFFGGIGRFDLAAAVKQAAIQPDLDRGLSLFLDRLPADPDFLRPPKVALDPEVKELTLTPGVDRTFDLIVNNDGMLLLEGVAYTDCDWIAFGDGSTGAAILQTQKMFQARKSCLLKVHVLGSKLRAGLIPMKGNIIVETNGGRAGAGGAGGRADSSLPERGRRQVGAGRGDVAARHCRQGQGEPERGRPSLRARRGQELVRQQRLDVPGRGPDGRGQGSRAAFLRGARPDAVAAAEGEAGLPAFRGEVGTKLSGHVWLYTREAKPIYGQATTDADWLGVGPLRYLGNKIRVPIEVTVPDQPGKTVSAEVTIEGNGKPAFVVAVSVMALPTSRINKIFKGCRARGSAEAVRNPHHSRRALMFHITTCPTCQTRFSIPEKNVGTRQVCPHCQSPFVAGKSVSEGPGPMSQAPANAYTMLGEAESTIRYNCPPCKKSLEAPASEAAQEALPGVRPAHRCRPPPRPRGPRSIPASTRPCSATTAPPSR